MFFEAFLCPCCKKAGFLILNGLIRGFTESSSSIRNSRGHYIICSARRKGGHGCGKSFPVFLSAVIKYHSISTESLWQFLGNISSKMSSIAAFRAVLHSYSDRTIHRFRSRLRKCQVIIRTNLLTLCSVPQCTNTDPLIQTITHLRAAFASSPDPVASYQFTFMTPLF